MLTRPLPSTISGTRQVKRRVSGLARELVPRGAQVRADCGDIVEIWSRFPRERKCVGRRVVHAEAHSGTAKGGADARDRQKETRAGTEERNGPIWIGGRDVNAREPRRERPIGGSESVSIEARGGDHHTAIGERQDIDVHDILCNHGETANSGEKRPYIGLRYEGNVLDGWSRS